MLSAKSSIFIGILLHDRSFAAKGTSSKLAVP
jgi:hypothetical protein